MTAKLLDTQVSLDGLLDVLGKNLYSTPAVAIRELVQNAHDACIRRQIEQAEPTTSTLPYAITLSCEQNQQNEKILCIKDNGSGLTEREIIDYLATVGSGYTRVLRDDSHNPDMVGYFGLGFLSAYVVSEKVEVWTCSYQTPELGWHFSSRGGKRYSLQACQIDDVGTTVKLTLSTNFASLGVPQVLAQLVQKYCCLLPINIYLQGQNQPLNQLTPPWQLPPNTSPLNLKKKQLAFAELFEQQFEPLCTIPINSDNAANLNGLLWIQDAGGFSTSDFRNVSVFIRNMHISNKERDLLPRWAGFVGCVIETQFLTPTASREDIQQDHHYQIAQQVISDTLVAGLKHIAANDAATWRRIILRHSQAMLGAAIADDNLFSLMSDQLKLPTNMGEMTLPQLLKQSGGKIYLRHQDKLSYEDILFKAKAVPVVSGYLFAAAQFSLKYADIHHLKVIEVGKANDDQSLFPPCKIPLEQQQYLTKLMQQTGEELFFSQFRPTDLPLVIVQDTQVALKKQIEQDEQDKKIGRAALMLAKLHTKNINSEIQRRIYINMDCPLIQQLLQLQHQSAKATQYAQLLRTFITIMNHDNQDKNIDFATQLQQFSQSLHSLISE